MLTLENLCHLCHVPSVSFVSSVSGNAEPDRVVREVVELVRKKVGAVASMRDAVVVPALPKTRSGMPIIVMVIVGLFYRISRSLVPY
jgi:hypothetical protein